MQRNVYEIFDEFTKIENRKDKIAHLRKYDSTALRSVVKGAFDKNIKFLVDKIPNYTPQNIPPGMGYSNIGIELRRLYLFVDGDPRRPATLTPQRADHILIQILEALEAREASVFINMLKKDLKVKGLTDKLVRETWPGLLD